jgi:hypothetical protein
VKRLALVGIVSLALTTCTSTRPIPVVDILVSPREGGPPDRPRDRQPLEGNSDQRPVDGGWPALCGKPRPAFPGTLCGRAAQPCTVEVNELVLQNNNLMPLVALELDDAGAPIGTYSTNLGSFVGHFIRRTGAAQWSDEKLPVPVAEAALGRLGADPCLYVDDGAMHQRILRRDSAGWSVVDVLPGEGWGGAPGGMAVDQAGCLHVREHFSTSSGEQAAYGLRSATGSWTFTPLANGQSDGPIALAPGGTPHLVFWGTLTPTSSHSLLWVASPGKPESVLPSLSSMTPYTIGLAVTGDDAGTPHIFVQRDLADETRELTLASRGTDAKWSLQSIASAPPSSTGCPKPTGPGQTCSYDRSFIRLLALVPAASVDGLRFLYAKINEKAQLTSSCIGGPNCFWQGDPVQKGTIFIAASSGGNVEQTVVVDGLVGGHASAAVDAQGRVHVLLTGPDTSLASELRYLRLAALP